jgi:cytochrome oxidase assembly protein ShyY1
MRVCHIFLGLALAAAAVGVECGLLTLANWQWGRYHQRLAQQAEFSARPAITLTGMFQNAQTVALDNQPNPQSPDDTQPGWRILTPLQTASGTIVIDRGWAPATVQPGKAPNFQPFQTSATSVSGNFQPYPQRHGWLKGPDTTTSPQLLAFLNPSLVTSQTTGPAYLIARTETSANLTAVPPPLANPQRHLSYALQWLGMALAFPILCGVGWAKNRRPKPLSR